MPLSNMAKRRAAGGGKENEIDTPSVLSNPWLLASHGYLLQLQKYKEEKGEEWNPNEQDEVGCTPLIFAARNGKLSTVKFLIEDGADMEAPGYGGMRALHHAVNNIEEECLTYLIEKGASCQARDKAGDTAIHWAASRGVLNLVSAVIDGGCDVNASNNRGVTPLMKAVSSGHISCAHRLVTIGADKDRQDEDGNTALHYAAKAGFANIVKYLLESGADAGITNKKGEKADGCAVNEATLKAFAATTEQSAKKRKARKKANLL